MKIGLKNLNASGALGRKRTAMPRSGDRVMVGWNPTLRRMRGVGVAVPPALPSGGMLRYEAGRRFRIKDRTHA